MGYRSGVIAEPEETNPKYATWDAKNSTVVSWLLNSMLPGISKGFLQPRKYGIQ